MKKFLSLVLSLALLCSVLSVAAAESTEPVTLRFSWWGGDARHEATLKVIEQFEALHPNVTIEAEYSGSDGYHDKLATQLAGGTAADIFQVDPETFPTYVTNNPDMFWDLNELGVNTAKFEAGYIGLPINGCYDGKQLGLPTGIAGPAILVNQDLATSLGVDLAKEGMTWDDLIELGKAVRAANPDVYLLCANNDYLVNLVVLTYAKQLVGGTVFQDGKLVLTEEQLTKIYEYVKALIDNEVVPSPEYMATYVGDNIQSDANWLAGKYVACLAYISTVDVMVAGNPTANYTTGTLPVEPGATEGGWASNTPQLLVIPKSCEHPEVAAAFLDYFFNDPVAMETLGAVRSVPPTAEAREISTKTGALTAVVSAASDKAMAVSGTPNDKIVSSAESKAIFADMVEQVIYGQMTPAEAAADTIMQLQDLEQ